MKKSELILYTIITILLISILAGTIGAFSSGHKIAENLRDADPSPKEISSLNKKRSDKIAAYTDLGQIRAVTKETNEKSGIPVVITPWLS